MNLQNTIILLFIFFSTNAYCDDSWKQCIPGSDTFVRAGNSLVYCGCDYSSYARSTDGTDVCTGGKYDSFSRSTDGRQVACGGE